MAIGIQVTKAVLDQRAGSTAQQLRQVFEQVDAIKEYLDQKTAQNLVDELGYTLQEANVVKSAWADLAQLNQLFQGAGNLPATKDFRTFVRQLWGLGI